jgi:integrase
MSVTQQQLQQQQEYLNLINSLRTEATITNYRRAIAHYLRFANITNVSEFLKQDNKAIESQIIKYLLSMREQKLCRGTLNLRLAALKKLCDMNDVLLNWKKISQYLGQDSKRFKDRAYTTEEIQQLLTKADERMRVVILLLASTGMRIGSIPDLKIRNLSKIESYKLYQIVVYENSKEEYYCFCSPECAAAIDSYLQYRERHYENITSDSPLIREVFNRRSVAKSPQRMQLNTLNSLLRDILLASGIRKIEHLTETRTNGRIKKEIAMSNGFRKKVTTDMIHSKVNPEAREMLLGHSIQLGDSYYRPHPDELLQEYLNCVDSLTINDEHRLKRKVEILEVKKEKIEQLEETLRHVKLKLGI